ncbi:MAG: class I SAM-dependent methyltransferase [Nitrospira sp.]|nr:class I SAM-dependent methyltransferase [bacterium]MBL7049273.1 class I SAM-dependent methyltransferase [Nitrospira sp.]
MEKLHKQYKALWGKEAEMLVLQRKIIQSKPVLRSMYDNFFREVRPYIPEDGVNIELGTGHGYSDVHFKNMIHTDMVLTPHISVCNDAMALPFRTGCLDSIMIFGTLHHLKDPDSFFKEASRALKKGGRIILIEPYVSLLSYPILKIFCPEDLNMSSKTCSSKYALLDANVAIPTILFRKERSEFEYKFPELKVVHETYHTAIQFFASGGYIGPNLFPESLLPALLWVEKILRPLGKWVGSMMTIVLQKQ